VLHRLLVAVALSGAIASPGGAIAAAKQKQVGYASWYGGPQHGQATASGERYDQNEMTAAHPSLPMNSLVRVTNLRNGRSVILRINDRGPRARDRVIDVSRRAAEMLGIKQRGVATVKVEAITD
jgi:rare lipoprotein A